MAEILIPLEIPNKADYPQVKAADRKIIATAVLMRMDNQTAYALYHPELLNGFGKLNDAGKQECRNFWSYGKNREYREAYEKCVEEFINGGKQKTSDGSRKLTEEEKTELKGEFSDKVYRALGEAEGLEQLKDAADLGKTTKIFKEEDNEEKPRRYLPRSCKECSYKRFVDEQVALGNIIEVKVTE